MLDIGMLEIFVIGALALIVVGPKELPGLLRTVGQFAAKARGMAREFQSSMEDAAREADLDGVVKTVKSGGKLPFDNQIVDTMKEFEKSVKTEINSADAEARKDDSAAPQKKFDTTEFTKHANPVPAPAADKAALAEPAKGEALSETTVETASETATPAAKAEPAAAAEKSA